MLGQSHKHQDPRLVTNYHQLLQAPKQDKIDKELAVVIGCTLSS